MWLYFSSFRLAFKSHGVILLDAVQDLNEFGHMTDNRFISYGYSDIRMNMVLNSKIDDLEHGIENIKDYGRTKPRLRRKKL